MTDQQRVTDEQLTEWTKLLDSRAIRSLRRESVGALIADLRASRAREADLARRLEEAEQARARTVVRFSQSAEAAKRYALEEERDGLLQRLEQQRADLEAAYEEAHNATQRAQELEQHAARARADAGLNAAQRDLLQQRIDTAAHLCTQGPDGDIRMPILELLQAIHRTLTGTDTDERGA